MRPIWHFLGHVFVVLTSAKSHGITFFCKVHSCTENCVVFMYDICMSPEHFEIKNKDLCPLQRFKTGSF